MSRPHDALTYYVRQNRRECYGIGEGALKMSGRYPEIVYTEEGMRKGMQVEDANIPIDAKVVLLDALSETGLKRIVVGSFVSPRFTPQMARIDELMRKFHPKVKTDRKSTRLNSSHANISYAVF